MVPLVSYINTPHRASFRAMQSGQSLWAPHLGVLRTSQFQLITDLLITPLGSMYLSSIYKKGIGYVPVERQNLWTVHPLPPRTGCLKGGREKLSQDGSECGWFMMHVNTEWGTILRKGVRHTHQVAGKESCDLHRW